MARDIFTVVLLEQQWMVRFHGRHSRPYATQGEAIAAAVASAYKAGMANPDGAQVRVQELQQCIPNGVDLRHRPTAAKLARDVVTTWRFV